MASQLDDISIINLLIDAMADRLITKMQIQATDEAKAGLIRAGKLQDDPTLRKVNILIHPGGIDWPDILNTENNGPGLAGPTYSIGGAFGSAFFRRRFIIEIQVFYPNDTSRVSTRTRALVVLSRIHNALFTMRVGMVSTDSFGETALQIQILESYLREGGGDGDFNWRGQMVVEFLTEIEPSEDEEEE